MDEKHNNTDADQQQPQLTQEELKLKDLVRMAEARRFVPCPDPLREWERVKSRLDSHTFGDEELPVAQPTTANMRGLKLWAYAATAIAAAFAGALMFVTYNNNKDDGSLVALDYDRSPQQITLTQDDEEAIDLSGKDSITYFNKRQQHSRKQPRQQQLTTPRGMDFKVILSDGTEVWLNAESTIKFPSSFLSGERRVELNGEAYFKVAQNPHRPFTVTTERMNIRVTGTEFNLRSYETEAPCVSLVSGSVTVINPDSKAAECRLQPGQSAWRDSKGAFHVGKADTYSVTQWVEGFFYFDDAPLVNILRELGRWYNLGVVFKDTSMADYKLHFSASRSDDLNETLSTISNIVKAQVAVEGTDIVVK